MLYRTPPHHTYFSQFPSATISSLSFLCPLPSSSFSSSSSSLQVQREMECVEAALKSSIRKEMALKSMIPQAILEDLCAVNVQNGTPCDDFSVDELLDFSNEQGLVEEEEDEEEDGEGEKICTTTVSVAPKLEKACQDEDKDSEQQRCTNFSAKDDFVYVPAGELGVPADDLASLEWLSHFVEDSNSEYSAPFPAGIFPEKPKMEAQSSEPERPVSTEPCFKTPVPAKARSKRTRTGVKVWPFGSPSITESSSSSATSSSSSSSPSSPWLICTNPGMTPEPAEPVCVEKPLAKKQKKKPALEAGASGGGGAQQPRRCSHCGVQKTPQWRAGPLGAKTLCNACGVRFKSGRLLPEYRPACSPTFSSELHSNHHRKVLEMRRKKEVLGQAEPVLAPPVISSFC